MKVYSIKQLKKTVRHTSIDGFVSVICILMLLTLYASIRSIILFGFQLNSGITSLLKEKSFLRNAATKTLKNGRLFIQDYEQSTDSILMQDDFNLTMLLTIVCAIFLPLLFALIYFYILHLSNFAKKRTIVLLSGFLIATGILFYYGFKKFLEDQEPYSFFLSTSITLIIYLFLFVFIIDAPKESGSYYQTKEEQENSDFELAI